MVRVAMAVAVAVAAMAVAATAVAAMAVAAMAVVAMGAAVTVAAMGQATGGTTTIATRVKLWGGAVVDDTSLVHHGVTAVRRASAALPRSPTAKQKKSFWRL